MSNILLTYDLQEDRLHESKHYEVKEAMKALGYMDSWSKGEDPNKVIYYLPNTTLWKMGENITPTTAKNDLLNCAKQCGAIAERLMAVEFTKWDGIPGKPYKK